MLEDKVIQLLRSSNYTVALSGYNMLFESGYPSLRDGDHSYEIEEKYGYSMDEIFHSALYSTRKELFYDFYREEILSTLTKPPGAGYEYLARLEELGLVHSIITRRIYGLPERAGCKNVINLHGNVYENFCPHCGREYPMEFIRDGKRVPLCTDCGTPVRPRVCLYGEMVDNVLMTKAANEMQKAEVLLLLGTNMKTTLWDQLIHHYTGDKLILINSEDHFADKKANVIIHKRVDECLKEICDRL